MYPASSVIMNDLLYLPSIAYFVSLKEAETLLINPEDDYIRQSDRNRTKILLTNKVETLSIPVLEGRKRKAIKEVKIDYQQKWLMVHLRGLQSAYGKSPFFEYFFSDLELVYLKKKKYLFDLNWELLTLCLKFLRWNVKMVTYDGGDGKKEFLDRRGLISSKGSYSGNLLYQPYPYTQIFGADFVPNLSIVDLLFCEGPMANAVIDHSQKMK
ncbi:MAG: WbqC family protein [Cyclobacteriaceae bacterium]